MTTDLAFKLLCLCAALIGVNYIVGFFFSYTDNSTKGKAKIFILTAISCISLLAIMFYIINQYL